MLPSQQPEAIYANQLRLERYYTEKQYEDAYIGTYCFDLLPEETQKVLNEYAEAHDFTMQDQIMLNMVSESLGMYYQGWRLVNSGKVRNIYEQESG